MALRTPASKPSFSAFFVVLEQLVHVVGGHRAPVRASCQRCNDLFGTSRLRIGLRAFGWMADENALTAGRRTDALRVERSPKLERAHAIHAVLAAAGCEHLQLIVGFGERPAFERHTDSVRSGRGEEADVLQARVDAIKRATLHLIVELHVLLAADHRLIDELVIEGHDQRVLELHAAAPDVRDDVGDIDGVLAVRRKIDFRENAAARTEWKAGRVGKLRAWCGAEGPPSWSGIRPAERFHGYGARGDDILFDEGGRHLQRGRNVVEAFGDVIGRQKLAGINLYRQEIAHRVGVFLPIEPMQDDLVRQMRRTGGCRAVERIFEPGDQRVHGVGIRVVERRVAA